MAIPVYSQSSKRRLLTAHDDLQMVFNHVLRAGFDHAILEGHRSQADQDRYYREGLSKVRVSKHNADPSDAIDARPYIAGVGYPEDEIYFYHFAGAVLAIAASLGIRLRWGGDWDSDGNLKDQSFMDLVHFELV